MFQSFWIILSTLIFIVSILVDVLKNCSAFLCQYLWRKIFLRNKRKYFTQIPGHNTVFWLEIWPAMTIWNDQSGLITYMYQQKKISFDLNWKLLPCRKENNENLREKKYRRLLDINEKNIPPILFSLYKPKIPSRFPFFQLKKFKKTQPTTPTLIE